MEIFEPSDMDSDSGKLHTVCSIRFYPALVLIRLFIHVSLSFNLFSDEVRAIQYGDRVCRRDRRDIKIDDATVKQLLKI